VAPGDAIGQRGEPRPDDGIGRRGDPDLLADDEPDEHPDDDRICEEGAEVRTKRNPGVREREQRHDQERDPRVERVFHAQHRRLGVLRQVLELPQCIVPLADLGLVGGLALEVAKRHAGVGRERLGVDLRSGGDREGEQDAGYRRMDAGLFDGDP
jgi:hypothetical protein